MCVVFASYHKRRRDNGRCIRHWQLPQQNQTGGITLTCNSAVPAITTVQATVLVYRGATTSSKLGGRIPCSRVLLPFYRKKIRQFGAVGYIITLYPSKSYVKSWGSVQIWGSGPPLTPSGCAHASVTQQRSQSGGGHAPTPWNYIEKVSACVLRDCPDVKQQVVEGKVITVELAVYPNEHQPYWCVLGHDCRLSAEEIY